MFLTARGEILISGDSPKDRNFQANSRRNFDPICDVKPVTNEKGIHHITTINSVSLAALSVEVTNTIFFLKLSTFLPLQVQTMVN